MATNPNLQLENIQDRLESTFEEYQQQHRYDKLERVGRRMEQTLIQQALANTLFKETFTLDSDIVDKVSDIKEYVEQDDINMLDDGEIQSLQEGINEQERQLNEKIQEQRMEKLETVQAFSQLNEELEFMDESRLSALKHLLDKWEWESTINVDDESSIDAKLAEAEETGEVMAEVYKDAQDALGNEFSGTQIKDLVDQLLNKDSLPVETLDAEEVKALSDSTVGPYLQLTLTERE